MSKAFTKDDRPDEPLVVRHRATVPDGVANYVTPRWMRLLREQLAQATGPHRAELEQRIASAVVAPAPADRGEVRFGARVTLQTEDGQERKIQIVGVDEADPAAGSIAFVAPLARALLGHRTGDTVTARSPGGTDELSVIAIDYDDET
ncbi:MAG TPA: GreA/GreB family elongation factor [Polyangia bacterium]|nr:GreA/GreB family elongation factor [Polyangia bacterium]